jgi:hypothetical protein
LVLVVIATIGHAEVARATSLSKVVDALILVSADADSASTHAGARDFRALSADCRRLNRHAATVLTYSRPTLISPTAWRYYRSAMSSYKKGSVLCIAGTKPGAADPSRIEAATAALLEGHKQFAEAGLHPYQ